MLCAVPTKPLVTLGVALAVVAAHADASAAEASRPAYQLRAEFDVPALGIGLVFATARVIRMQQPQKPYCAPRCDPADLNAFDRLVAGNWNRQWSDISKVAIVVVGAAPIVYLTVDEQPLDALNDLVVIGESAALASAASTLVTTAAARPRPYLYGDKAPQFERESTDASQSFSSSHTSIAFAISTSTWMTYRRLHPDTAAHWGVLAAGDAAATLVGVARMIAGYNFPTDIISGAILGTSVGVLVPALHDAPVKITPTTSMNGAGLAMSAGF